MNTNTADTPNNTSDRLLTPVDIGLLVVGVGYAGLSLADVIDWPWFSVIIMLAVAASFYRDYRHRS